MEIRGGGEYSLHLAFHFHQAIGCPSLRARSGMTAKISGDIAMVTCESTGGSWQMTCRNGRWHGKLGNCTAGR